MAVLLKFTLILYSINIISCRKLDVQSRNKDENLVQSSIQKLISAAQDLNNKDYVTIRPSSCADLMIQGYVESGIYTIYPKPWFDKPEVAVYCDMETDGGGWTIIQRRHDYTPRQSFIQNWEAYRQGFGQLDKEFWLGNDNIHILTNQDYVTLRIDLADFEGDIRYVVYNQFQVAGCNDNYRLKIAEFSGTTGDSLSYGNNATFFTFDQDNVHKCAEQRKSGWWFTNCANCNLNGQYLNGKNELAWKGVVWHSFKGESYSLQKSEMKIRPNNFHR